MCQLVNGEGLKLKCSVDTVCEKKNPSFLAIRQDCHCFEAATTFSSDDLYDGVSAGMILYQNEDYNLRFEYTGCRGNVILRKAGVDEKIASLLLPQNIVTMVLNVIGTKASLFMVEGKELKELVKGIDISALSTEVAGGFVGCTIGLFATTQEEDKAPTYVTFKSLSYKRISFWQVQQSADPVEAHYPAPSHLEVIPDQLLQNRLDLVPVLAVLDLVEQ